MKEQERLNKGGDKFEFWFYWPSDIKTKYIDAWRKKNRWGKSYIYSERVSFVIALKVISEILQFAVKLYVDIRKSIEKASCFLKKRMSKNFCLK